MRAVVRWTVIVVVLVHGLIHLLGVAKGFGWADVDQLQEPISAAMGVSWLVAAVVVLAAGAAIGGRIHQWWLMAAGAAIVSQAVIVTAWSDAGVGTVANVLLLLAAGYGYASQGPSSYRAEYRRRVEAALAEPHRGGVVTEADLAHLPPPVAEHVRRSGAIGQPRVTNLRARMHGRIRSAADRPWMRFTGEQVNTFGPEPARLFFIDATMFGLPVDVLHVFVGPEATMRVKVCSLVRMVDASGPDMQRAETVTIFNDLCILAPAALIDAPITWDTVDGQHVIGTYTRGAHTVTAELVFDDRGELVNFISDDRLAGSPDGKGFTPRRWSTPLHSYTTFGRRRVAATGEGRWHPAAPEPGFTYLELHLDDVAYNVTEADGMRGPGPAIDADPASRVTITPSVTGRAVRGR